MQLQHFENQFLPNALRKFFKETAPLSVRNDILSDLIAKFSERFCACNPHLQLSQGKTVLPWCFFITVDLHDLVLQTAVVLVFDSVDRIKYISVDFVCSDDYLYAFLWIIMSYSYSLVVKVMKWHQGSPLSVPSEISVYDWMTDGISKSIQCSESVSVWRP